MNLTNNGVRFILYAYNYSLTEYINLWNVSKLYYDEVK